FSRYRYHQQIAANRAFCRKISPSRMLRPKLAGSPCGVRRLAAAFAQSAIQKEIPTCAIIESSPLTKNSALLKSKWIRPSRPPTGTRDPERIRQGCAKDLNINAIAEPSVNLRLTKPCADRDPAGPGYNKPAPDKD